MYLLSTSSSVELYVNFQIWFLVLKLFIFFWVFWLQFGAQVYNTAPGLTFDPQTPREYAQGSTPSEWLHMQIGGTYERVT